MAGVQSPVASGYRYPVRRWTPTVTASRQQDGSWLNAVENFLSVLTR
jgi:hypothetical protein